METTSAEAVLVDEEVNLDAELEELRTWLARYTRMVEHADPTVVIRTLKPLIYDVNASQALRLEGGILLQEGSCCTAFSFEDIEEKFRGGEWNQVQIRGIVNRLRDLFSNLVKISEAVLKSGAVDISISCRD